MYNCKNCGEPVLDGKKWQIKSKMCRDCYLQWERDRHKTIKQNKGQQKRICPNCGAEHTSPGYCYERCKDCHNKKHAAIDARWRNNNREEAVQRTLRWQKKNHQQHSEYMKKWGKEVRTPRAKEERHKRKRTMVEEHGGKCIKCGYAENYAALTFHHRDPNTKEDLITEIYHNVEKLRVEAAKCDLLCSNCHREVHGVGSLYREKKLKLRFVVEAGAKCKCGYDKNIAALTFHHTDPTNKTMAMQKAFKTHNLKTIRKELKKCELLCANCHAEVHHPDLNMETSHG